MSQKAAPRACCKRSRDPGAFVVTAANLAQTGIASQPAQVSTCFCRAHCLMGHKSVQ